MNRTYTPPKDAPGPQGLPVIGTITLLRHPNLLQLFLQWREEFGDIVRWRVGPRLVHMVNAPEAIKHILQMNNKNYSKGQGYVKLKPLLGEGLVTSEGDFWRRQRRLSQPAFQRKQIHLLVDTMVQSARNMREGWSALAHSGEAFDVNEQMMRVTLDIVSRALFGAALSEQEFQSVADALTMLLEETVRRAMRPWFVELPTQTTRIYHQHIADLDRIIYRIISERRASGEQKDDLLGMLLAAQDEETGEQMDDQQLRDEVMTLFLAGHETTANALSWTWMVLSQYPTIRAQVEAEVAEVIGEGVPTTDELQALTFTKAMFEEVMRLHPPVPAFARRALNDDEIGGFRIPAGSNMLICPYVLHRHPGLWENPEGFDPSRFTEEKRKEQHKFAYLPFGGGPRFCIGNHFAMMEALAIIAVVVQRYRVDLMPHHPIERSLSLTLRPKHGILATLRPRT